MPPARTSRSLRTTAMVAIVALLLVACGQGDEETGSAGQGAASPRTDGGDGPLIVVTTSILGDVVGTLVGDDGTVEVIMAPGTDPHGFEPSAQDAARLREADLVIANGLQLEASLLSALEAAREEGVRVFEVADHLDPIEFDLHPRDDHEDHEGPAHDDEEPAHHDHGHGPWDPHVWFDPVRMAAGAKLIAAELAEVVARPEADEWERRGQEYADMLTDLDEELRAILAAVQETDRRLVTNHEALGYFAHRYDFEILGTVVPGASTQAEADARGFAELIETVERAGVSAIFAENTDSTALADQLASEVVSRGDLDVEVVGVYTDALGEPGSGAETYPELLRTTATRIADALS